MICVVDGDKLRLHFNRHGAAPLVWCVTILDKAGVPRLEIATRGFYVLGVPIQTVYRPKATADDDDGIPSAWLAPATSGPVLIEVLESGWVDIKRSPSAPEQSK